MRGNDRYATIMKYFYLPCGERPRVLALTASPVEKAREDEPDCQSNERPLSSCSTVNELVALTSPV